MKKEKAQKTKVKDKKRNMRGAQRGGTGNDLCNGGCGFTVRGKRDVRIKINGWG